MAAIFRRDAGRGLLRSYLLSTFFFWINTKLKESYQGTHYFEYLHTYTLVEG